ncbi:MAG TPA: oligopeptide/dipeptide ABC transporter ATP-binding protein [Steroidobacteraceae bacterium]|jgi:oligopeptide transport system ATP-binding protein|nr:oligopeptide/dipeptide ABC transporter ATP-binding protein [Steroidobacteraceae bacterium]
MSGLDTNDSLLRVTDLRVRFGTRTVLCDVSFDLFAGETLGLVGESGSGKSTLARAILRLVHADRGAVLWRGQDLLTCDAAALRRLRRDLQIVFQDPLASLNPRMTIGESIAEPLRIFAGESTARQIEEHVAGMLERVGLDAGMLDRYPHEFSGGQCQRVGIARAMILLPKLLICDEPVSSLDVSIQGQIVNLLLDLQRDTGAAMLFISHNLAVVRHLSHRILVMYAGRIVEIAARDDLFAAPVHPYTRALLAAVPPPPAEASVRSVPVLTEAPATEPPTIGCAYRDRCAYAVAVCAASAPALEAAATGHWVACHRSRELLSFGS